ncbi:MAG: histone deacetylase family protein [Candidatus Loosdrechtia sp.]|uniref:histone deacetylase family protein n=1 Tax=Candidatus Loosdrechtia sp. TaxID=3101272 RepID=UPI003A7453F3|nr:MAG: histone deacetylase [Candidatus Jettenia sp. AMX2]
MTILIYDDIFLQHDTGDSHPENAKRLKNTVKHLRTISLWTQLRIERPRVASSEEIAVIHPQTYIQSIKKTADAGGGWIDSDTIVSTGSYNAAVHAVGAALTASDLIMSGENTNAFCLVRPPGHHATPTRAMGFCLFNTVAIAAKYLQSQYHLEKILIIDWDVHHGNGTQEAFYDDPTVMYLSLHRYPFYPGSGKKEETGRDKGNGYTINMPLPATITAKEYSELFTNTLEQNIHRFAPEFIIISAGFDTYKKDPIGGLHLDKDDFGVLTDIVIKFAKEYCSGRIISCLEGGYHLTDLPLCIDAHLKALLRG